MEWVAVAALVVAVLTGVGTVLAARQWGNRRRRILFSVESAPLLPPAERAGLLQVTFRDFPVENPHLVTVRVQNVGPLDIATQHFDAHRNLVVDLNCTMYGVTSSSHPGATVSRGIGSEGVVELTPSLLRRGDAWVVEAVVSGEPTPELDSPLIDTDVVDGATYLEQLAEILAGTIVTLPLGVSIRLRR